MKTKTIKHSPKLAEIIGIHFGDGCLHKPFNYTYRISYSCNINEVQYADEIEKLFKKVFGINLRRLAQPHKSLLTLYFYSKELHSYMQNVLQIPMSPKKNLRIPSYIIKNEILLTAFIRGIFDTDGCITFQKQGKYEYILAKMTTKWRGLAEDLKFGLTNLNIKSFICASKYGYDVVIRNRNVPVFLRVIIPRNHYKLKKVGSLGLSKQKP